MCVCTHSHSYVQLFVTLWTVTHQAPLSLEFTSVQFSRSVVSDSLRLHEPQHARPPCPSPAPGVYPNSCPLSQWCHPTILSSVAPFSSCPQSFPESGSFQISQLFISGGQSIGVSASTSVPPMNIQDWSPLGWAGWISLQPKGLWRVFSNVQLFICVLATLCSMCKSMPPTLEGRVLTTVTIREFPL